MSGISEVLAELKRRLPNIEQSEFRGQRRVEVSVAEFESLIDLLKTGFGFDYLVDITCVDYLHYRGATHRFGLVYLLAQVESAMRITVRVMLDEPHLRVPSLVSRWEGANWMEREVWDMFGIEFVGHPDLRRILLPEEFTAHPLRKDYPLQGRGERHNFPVIARGQA